MIKFVNAKLNLGLYITSRREDGYHNLATIFYPVGLYNGTPLNPSPFCDILEVVERNSPSLIMQTEVADSNKVDITEFDFESTGLRFKFLGRKIDCDPEKNLVVKGARSIFESLRSNAEYDIYLEKHLPDGAGLGGGSADCAFAISMINEIEKQKGNLLALNNDELRELAAGLGADCPFFIDNVPSYGEGIGEILTPVDLDLSGKWCLIIKPNIYVSTAEAFRGIKVSPLKIQLREEIQTSPDTWKGKIENKFEESIFRIHPELGEIKGRLYESGALYASMSGSGSSLFGIYDSWEDAEKAKMGFDEFSCFLCAL